MNLDVWLIFQDDQLVVLKEEESQLPGSSAILHLKAEFARQHFIGQFNQLNVYCAELLDTTVLTDEMTTLPLRKAMDLLEPDWYDMLVRAYAILNWDKNHHYCGRCGHPTNLPSSIAFERTCPQCGLAFYPRISPSIIVLIYKDDQILMARSPHFPRGAYGLIAGFIEAGENIEQAVHREVKEEVNIEIKNLQYIGSQPWPFPDSLMIGFIAEYAAGEITINPSELEDADWYHYDHLPGRPSSRVSIANKIIDYFIDQKRKGYAYGSL